MKKDIKSTKKYINFLNAYQYVQSIARIISHQNVTVRKSQHIDRFLRQELPNRYCINDRLFDAISRSFSIFPQEIRKTRRAHFRLYEWRYTISP